MDTNSTESTITTTTRSAELLSKRKRKNQRYKANRKARKLSQLKDADASKTEAKTEESSVEDVATSKNFDSQLLPPPAHVEMGTEPAKNLFEVNAVGKKKWKKRQKLIDSNLSADASVKMKAAEVVSSNLPEGSGDKFPHDKLEGAHDSRPPPLGHLDMGTESAKNLSEINAIGKKKRKKRQKLSNSNLSVDDSVKMKATEVVSSNVPEVSADKCPVDKLEVAHDSRLPPLQKNGQINSNISADDSVKVKATVVVSSNVLEVSADKFPVDKLEVVHDSLFPPLGHLDMGTESAENLFEINAVGKKKRKKRRKNGQINSNISADDSVKMKATEVVSSNVPEFSADKFPVDKLEVAHDSRLPPLEHLDMGTESSKNLFDINAVGKKKRKKRQKNGQINLNISADDFVKMKATEVVSNVPEVSADKFPVDKLEVAHDSMLPPLEHLDMGTESAKNLFEINAVGKKKRKKRRKNGQISSNISADDSVKMKATEVVSSNVLEDSADKFSVDKLEGARDSRIKEVNTFTQGKKKNCYVEEAKGEANEVSIIANVHPSPCWRKKEELQTSRPCLKRKLLILDVNGLLADIVHPPPRGGNPDTCFWRRAIFKRPFCDDFLNFCFQRFDVAIWSSRSKRIIDRVVDYLLGKLQQKLLFCWDMSHSTQTSFKTLENPHKPLVFKELRKVWDIYDPGLPWKRGDYDESNTLLLDDSPYKALLNPAHTAICPVSYNFRAENDNSLGPGGDLRIYLEELSKSEHIQKYVEQHPFGQARIDATSSDWKFYSGILSQMTGQSA